MTFEEIYNQIKDLKGWMPEKDCEMLWQYTKELKKALIVEIGCFMGRSTKTMALSSPTSQIIGIDPSLTVHSSSGETDPEYVMKRLKKVMKGLNWKLIRVKSQDIGQTWDKPIDFLHIDGDHHVVALKKDIELFVPHVKKGSYVFFHDYNNFGSDEDSGGLVKWVVDNIADKYFDEVISEPQVYGFAICRKK